MSPDASRPTKTPPTQPFEIHVEPDDGFYLESGETWSGYRIRYRPLGSRGRWAKFIIVDEIQQPSLQQLQDICERHASGL